MGFHAVTHCHLLPVAANALLPGKLHGLHAIFSQAHGLHTDLVALNCSANG
jgi:hypothetical protein